MGLFRRAKPERTDPQLARLARNLDEAEIRYLEVLRREVANMIVASDPNLMLRAYKGAWGWETTTFENPALAKAEELALVTRIPRFEDFDLIGTRHFVTYDEALSSGMVSDDILVDRYLDLSKMLVFMAKRSEVEAVRNQPVHDRAELKVLVDNMRRETDRKFRGRIKEALRRCWAYRQGFDSGKGEAYAGLHETYSDAEVEVWQIPYGASSENETGIIFKKTDEFGIYGFFVDVTRDKTYHSYYRTDSTFKERQPLPL